MKSISLCLLLLLSAAIHAQETKINQLNDSVHFWLEADIIKANQIGREVLELAKAKNYLHGMSEAYMSLAALANHRGDFVQALSLYDSALQIRIQLGNKLKIANSKSGIASTYVDFAGMERDSSFVYFNRARELYSEARSIYSNMNSFKELAKNDIQLGHLYGVMNDPSRANSYFIMGFKHAEEIGDSVIMARAARNLASGYVNMQLLDSGLIWSDSLFKYACASCHELKIGGYQTKGLAYFLKVDDDSAKHYYDLSKEMLESHNFPLLKQSLYDLYKEFFFVTDNIDSVYYYDSLLTVIHDSIIQSEQARLFLMNSEMLHTSQKEREAHQAKNQAMVSKRNQIIAILSAIGVMLTAFFLIRTSRQKRRIAEKENELTHQKIDGLLQTQEMKRIDAMLEGQEQERKRIASDLHDRLGSILGAVKLHFNTVEEHIDVLQKENKLQYEKAKTLLDEASQEVRQIAHNMVSGTLMKFGLLSAVMDLKNDLELSNSIIINVFHSGMSDRLSADLEIQIYRMIQELISNVLKHASATKIEIGLNQIDSEFNVTFEDNGKGFDSNSISEGLGFQNLRQRAAKFNGTVDIHSKTGRGTQVTITLPIIQTDDD